MTRDVATSAPTATAPVPSEQRDRKSDGTPERSFRALRILAIVLPALLFIAAAWYDHDQITEAAKRRVVATANAMAEHAEKVLETNRLVLSAVAERTRGMDWEETRHSESLHRYLERLTAELPQLQSTFVVDPTGHVAASSRAFPMPPYDVTQRDYFIAARDGATAPFISAPFAGQDAGTVAFTVTRPRTNQGVISGLVGVTLSPEYFAQFYATLLDPSGRPLASLMRADGVFLIRYPPRPNSPPALQAASFLRPGGAALQAGVFEGASRVNGKTRLGAVHELAGLPLLTSYSVEAGGYLAIWYQHTGVLALFALVLIVVLSLSARAAIRHAHRERTNLRILLAETTRREEAEGALRQLQKIEALGRITGGVAHDFNNLLTAIMGSLELAMRRVQEPRVARLLDGAMEASKRGARLTQQMLAFSRQQHVQLMPIAVNDTVSGVDNLLRRSLTPEIDVRYELAPDVWPALADATQLEVAILNLVINARDAMQGTEGSKAGGTITLRTACLPGAEPRPAGVPAGDFVAVSVSDEGQGMTDEVRRRAIEPFFTTKGVGHGTGLGLSMVHGFVLQAGGALGIESAPGRGTTVRLFLPRAATLPAPPPPAVDASSGGVALDILLLDDDAQVRGLTADMLRELGHRVTECGDGPSASSQAAIARPDLMIVDYAMPEMSGSEVVRNLKGGGADFAFLFISGYAESDALQEWTSQGYRLLLKPFSLDQLADAVAAATRADALSGVPGD